MEPTELLALLTPYMIVLACGLIVLTAVMCYLWCQAGTRTRLTTTSVTSRPDYPARDGNTPSSRGFRVYPYENHLN